MQHPIIWHAVQTAAPTSIDAHVLHSIFDIRQSVTLVPAVICMYVVYAELACHYRSMRLSACCAVMTYFAVAAVSDSRNMTILSVLYSIVRGISFQ